MTWGNRTKCIFTQLLFISNSLFSKCFHQICFNMYRGTTNRNFLSQMCENLRFNQSLNTLIFLPLSSYVWHKHLQTIMFCFVLSPPFNSMISVPTCRVTMKSKCICLGRTSAEPWKLLPVDFQQVTNSSITSVAHWVTLTFYSVIVMRCENFKIHTFMKQKVS